MALYVTYFLAFVFVFIVLLLFLKSYWSFKKKISTFPFYNILPYVIYSCISGKVTKDTPFNNLVLEKLIEVGKSHMKEGFFMTHFSPPQLFIYGENAIKFFATETAMLSKSPEYKIIEDVIKAGIGISNGERWRKHKKIINPAFHMRNLQEKTSLFNEHALNLVTDMEKMVGKTSVDIAVTLKVHYFNALCESIFGLKVDNGNKAEFLKFQGQLDDLSIMSAKRFNCPWLRPKFLLQFFPSGRKFLYQKKAFADFIDKLILDMKRSVYSNNSEDTEGSGSHSRKSYAYILLNQHLNDPTFTLEDVQSEMSNMLAAGYDTATISTLWCLFLLGLHPEVQEQVYNEILTATSNYVTYEETTNLHYLEAVLMESLRIFPTVPIFARELSENVQYGKHKVFKGTTIVLFSYLAHRNPEIYPDPEEFKPERFLNTELRKSCTFIPFAEGSRSCIGKNYAIIELKIFLSHILRNFKVTSLDRREDVKLCWSLGLLPVHHLRFNIQKR